MDDIDARLETVHTSLSQNSTWHLPHKLHSIQAYDVSIAEYNSAAMFRIYVHMSVMPSRNFLTA